MLQETNFEKTVYLVRHGQSEGNIAAGFQAPDSPLTEKGREQAALVAGRIANISFDAFIVSPLPRARETAEAIMKTTGKQPEYSELFVERVKPMKIHGQPYENEDAEKLWQKWEQSLYTPGLRAEDGENFDDLVARADKALDFLHNRPEKTLVVVTHGFFLRTIIARVVLGDTLTGESFRSFQTHTATENAGLSVLTFGKSYEGMSWRLWIYNDHAHLG